MINMPSDFNTARAYDGQSATPALTVGGHICKIMRAYLDTARTGTQMLVIEFDIAESGDLKEYYLNRFERSLKYNQDAKWPGVFRAPIANSDGRTSGYFKGLITAVEESNPTFKFGGEEATLENKYVGFNFGEEEWPGRDGQMRVSVKPFYAVSVQHVKDGIEPPPRKGYRGSAPAQKPAQNAPQGASQGFQEVTDDELPF